jgi:hypothetical protein
LPIRVASRRWPPAGFSDQGRKSHHRNQRIVGEVRNGSAGSRSAGSLFSISAFPNACLCAAYQKPARRFRSAPSAWRLKKSLTLLLSPVVRALGILEWSSAMVRISPRAPISCASRRRLARWLVGSPIRDIERDLVLETLVNTRGNRTASARLLGVSVRTLRNKITEYSAEGVDVPRRESRAS